MKLSAKFAVDASSEAIRRHNVEALEVVDAYRKDRPVRVPVLCGEWVGQHGFYADETGLDYAEYYGDPGVMLKTQLEAARRRREIRIYDLALGEPPKNWTVSVDFWPVVAPGWAGCEVQFRHDSVPAHRGRNLGKEECLGLAMPDPRTGGLLGRCGSFWTALKQLCTGLTFLGRPVGPAGHGVGTNGVFSLALDLRGPDLMADMHDDPDFADEFLRKMAAWCDALERAWCEAEGRPVGPFQVTDHGIDMLSGEMYERFIVPVVLEVNRRRGTVAPTLLHHCGRGAHLFPVIKRRFGLERLHMLTFPLIDVARVKSELGEEVWITAAVADQIIQAGPPERIRQTVKDLLSPGAKGCGRLALCVGDMLKGTPMDHRTAFYEAVREFGGYGP
jgi:hypothetical protein